jgi:hydroxybutyrate-dimer hydrolase
MRQTSSFRLLLSAATLALVACAGTPDRPMPEPMPPLAYLQHDDLLTAGLGLDGLRNPTPPPFANPAAPSAEELRRRALWTNWRGIADLAPGGGYGELYGSLAPAPGAGVPRVSTRRRRAAATSRDGAGA